METRDLWDGTRQAYVHGNGFIQVDIPGGHRLHVWGHPDIPRQKVPTPIHNHRFGFRSRVLRGRLFNILIDAAQVSAYQATHYCCTVQRREGSEDTKLLPLRQRRENDAVCVCVRVICTQLVEVGYQYGMSPLQYHESATDRPTVSVMTKRETLFDKEPVVLVPMGLAPDNEFDRDSFCQQDLRKIVDEVCKGLVF